jgi:23S rRNA (uridine2552-2'-O)-methyltransferase
MAKFLSKEYFKKLAKAERYKSRSAYKLIEINDKFNIFKKKFSVLDLGCAPGGWSQVASKKVGKEGLVVGVDLQPVELNLENFAFIKGDFTKEKTKSDISACGLFDVVISDAAPEFSGIKERDIGLSLSLNEDIFELCKEFLRDGGSFIVKAFQGPGLDNFVKKLKRYFSKASRFKPKSSSKESAEIYLACKGFKRT